MKSQVYIIENLGYLTDLVRKIRPQEGGSGAGVVAKTGVSTIETDATLRPCDLRLFVMPMKSKGTGAPTRVIAYCK